jgi:hypothetical protein
MIVILFLMQFFQIFLKYTTSLAVYLTQKQLSIYKN